MKHLTLLSTLAPLSTLLTAASLAAQVPSPVVQSRTAPRAEYVVTTGVTGTVPTNRHWSQAAGNDTSLFVFGGRTGTSGSGSRRNDLYEFDATTNAWTEHNADGDPSAPPQRFMNTLAWDPVGNRLIMFGGQDAAGNLFGDTWEWVAATNTWTNLNVTGPSARRFSSMTYDPNTGGLILFGGDDQTSTLNDTWLFISNTWVNLAPANAPGPRGNHTLVTRPDFGDVFMCGGHDNGASPGRIHYTDAWVLDSANGTWIPLATSTTAVPHGMAGNQAVYDSARQRVVLTGGQGLSTNSGATGGAYGTEYGGSPSSWTSEFDCRTNEWVIYGPAAFSTADSVIGRSSRYYSAFVPAAGKIFFWGGQNPSGTGASLSAMKEYQASPVASTSTFGSGCAGSAGVVGLSADNDPWLGRSFSATVSNLTGNSLVWVVSGLASTPTPLSALDPRALPGCDLLLGLPVGNAYFLVNTGGTAAFSLNLPNNLALAGASLDLQAIQVERSSPSQISAITSSNGLTITAGGL